MKNRLAVVFKFFLIIALIIFIGIAVFAGVIWAKWPLWVCFFIAAGMIGMFLGVRIRNRISDTLFRRFFFIFMFVLGLYIVVRAFF